MFTRKSWKKSQAESLARLLEELQEDRSTVGKLILNITVNNCILKRRKLDNNGASFLGNKYVDEYLGRYSKLSNLD